MRRGCVTLTTSPGASSVVSEAWNWLTCPPSRRLTVNVSGTLEAELNGVGNIRYAGNPQKVEPQINGVGRIAPVDTPATP